MQFKANFFVVAALVAAALATTVPEVKNAIQAATTQTRVLDSAIDKLPNIAVSNIHSGIVALEQLIDRATSDIKGITGPISESDAQSIIVDTENIKPVILDVLTKVAAKKSAFAGAIAQTSQDLKDFASSTSGFGTTLAAAIPSDLKPRFKVVQDDLTSGFVKAIAAFSS